MSPPREICIGIVCAGIVLLTAKGAQATGGYANVGRIQVAVDIEVRLVAVHALADVVGQPPHAKNVAAAVECEGVFWVQALAGKNFGVNGPETRIVGLERMSRSHPYDHTAPQS